jgi:hypothetical protein
MTDPVKTGREANTMKESFFRKPVVFLSVLLLMSLTCVLSLTYEINGEEKQKPCLDPKVNSIVPNAARPGDEIRILGVRFRDEPGEVTFSPGVPGTITRWHNKKIYVIVPESATSGPITVSIPCGAVSNKMDFTVEKKSE